MGYGLPRRAFGPPRNDLVGEALPPLFEKVTQQVSCLAFA